MERKWSLVVHEVGLDSAVIWVGTLSSSLMKPDRWRLVYWSESPNTARTREFKTKSVWSRPFSGLGKRFYYVEELKKLEPGKHYTVRFQRRVDKVWMSETEERDPWITLAEGYFDTLPRRIPKVGRGYFTVGLGSCFYDSFDGNSVSDAYSAVYDKKDGMHRPHLKFLVGDQVYLDIGLDSLSSDVDDVRHRIADDYKSNWEAMSEVLNRGGTWMIPDDHEFWNNYPFYKGSINPYLFRLKNDQRVHDTWVKAAREGIRNVQRCPIVTTFDIGQDLSFCIADLRTYRTDTKFIGASRFNEMIEWATTLSAPGVLVIPQPLIQKEGPEEDWNLLNYPDQYGELLRAMASSGHDIVVLTGDVHYGRIARVPLGDAGGTLYEVISSPLSNLTWLNALATSSPSKITHFPTIPVSGITKAKVKYAKRNWSVSTVFRLLDLRYPRRRTREHFMTLKFARKPNKSLQLEIEAWQVRSFSRKTGLPKKDFTRSVGFELT